MELINDNMQQDLSEDIPECRICFDPEAEDDMLLNPCLCNGTSKYVHMRLTTSLLIFECKFFLFDLIEPNKSLFAKQPQLLLFDFQKFQTAYHTLVSLAYQILLPLNDLHLNLPIE